MSLDPSDPERTYDFLAECLGKLGLAHLYCIEWQTRGQNAAGALNFKALHDAFGGKYIDQQQL